MAITGLEMADLVREVCHDGGSGPLTLGGAAAGLRFAWLDREAGLPERGDG